MMFNNTGNHSDDLDGHRCPLPMIKPSHPDLFIRPPPTHEQQPNLSTTMKMGSKLSETIKGKVRLGARIIQKGGWENIFKDVFWENKGEKLLKASQCYLSTTAGPVVGILFISTQKVAFCSDRSFTLRSPNGDLIQQPYKEVILTNQIKEVNEKNVENPSQKYIQIVTDDKSEYWFMGFVRYEKAIHNLRKSIYLVSN